jgi:hypothetical protein
MWRVAKLERRENFTLRRWIQVNDSLPIIEYHRTGCLADPENPENPENGRCDLKNPENPEKSLFFRAMTLKYWKHVPWKKIIWKNNQKEREYRKKREKWKMNHPVV